MRVEVYWNLHKLCWSVRALEGESKGRVIQHTGELNLKDCTMAVQPAGNAKVRKEGKKNVHAFIRGELVDTGTPPVEKSLPIIYNPYKYTSFMKQHSLQVVVPTYRADYVAFRPDGSVRSWVKPEKRGVAWGTAKGRKA